MRKFFFVFTIIGLLMSCNGLSAGTTPGPSDVKNTTTDIPQIYPSSTFTSSLGPPIVTITEQPDPTIIIIQTPYFTDTPIPASNLKGTWHRYTTEEGFCTDWPHFIGGLAIGMDTTSLCSYYEGKWDIDRVVPQGSRVNAYATFPPGGGQEYATDVGICISPAWVGAEWQCHKYGDSITGYGLEPLSYPDEEIKAIVPLNVEAVYMSKNKVFFRNNIYKLQDIVGAENAVATWLAVSSDILEKGFLVPEIWVGTNDYGVVVIQPSTGNIRRYTTDNGLPGNDIRDIQTEYCTKFCDFRDIWVATDKGVAHWNNSQWVIYTTADGLPSNDVRGVSSLSRNTVWVATGGGAAYFDGNSWKVYTLTTGLPSGDLNGVLAAGSNEILFSTRGSGLIVFSMDVP